MTAKNVDAQEIAKFEALSAYWWDTTGPLRTLHEINPIRLAFVQQYCQLDGHEVLDVGCGGGILAESLAKAGAKLTAIDMDAAGIDVASRHAIQSQLNIDYRHMSIEELAIAQPQHFDVITCMEMLEHVPNPSAIIAACAQLLKPGGKLFVSTINRHPKAYALAILGAEYVLNLLPKGTHDYHKFIKPSELEQWARHANLTLRQLKGVRYHPYSRQCELTDDVKVNYLAYFENEG